MKKSSVPSSSPYLRKVLVTLAILLSLPILNKSPFPVSSLGSNTKRSRTAVNARFNGSRLTGTPHFVQNHHTHNSVAFCIPNFAYMFRAVFSTVRVETNNLLATSFLLAPHASNSATCVSRLLNSACSFMLPKCFQ